MGKILVVDDQRNMRTTLAMMLRGGGHEVEEAAEGGVAADVGAKGAFDVVLTDLRLGQVNGIDVLRAVKDVQPMTEVIVMTAYGTIESAVEAMRLGAFDYIQKPFTEQELLVKVDRALERRRLSGQVSLLATEFREKYRFENIVGRSQPVRDVLSRIVRVAPTDATVLITGESGTGKEMVAKAIHANSMRSDKPFVPVNCAAITETLLESELFGHARGSFTGAVAARKGLFEEADGGTFFFDEIAETPLSFQAKLLRVIQEGEVRRIGENKATKVDVRIIAATNQDLNTSIAEKRFRQDLYYRLNVARFQLPPLRERREDIPLLIEFFREKYTVKMNRKAQLAEGVMEQLMRYDFPGNVRELENMVEQAVALSTGGLIQADDIIPETARPVASTGRSLAAVVDAAERQAIETALRDCDGSRERAAELLDISPTTLWRKMTRLHITYEQRALGAAADAPLRTPRLSHLQRRIRADFGPGRRAARVEPGPIGLNLATSKEIPPWRAGRSVPGPAFAWRQGSMPRVLVIDDEPNQRRTLAIGLRLEGFEVTVAGNAHEALEQLLTITVDVVLVDLMMPGVNGLDFARQMRTLHPGVPVVLTSAYHLSERQLARADAGVVGFVPKPCAMPEMAKFLHAKAKAAVGMAKTGS